MTAYTEHTSKHAQEEYVRLACLVRECEKKALRALLFTYIWVAFILVYVIVWAGLFEFMDKWYWLGPLAMAVGFLSSDVAISRQNATTAIDYHNEMIRQADIYYRNEAAYTSLMSAYVFKPLPTASQIKEL